MRGQGQSGGLAPILPDRRKKKMYILNWKSPALDVNKGTPIQVPVGTIVSDKASIRFTGKGAANYGTVQQENLMRLLENFADGTAPAYPTVGQLWYDSTNAILRLCASTAPLTWKSLAGIQVTNNGEEAPTSAALGDIWFQRTGSSSGILYVYTGLGRYPVSGTTIGGWNQVWPTVDFVAGREEYEAALSLLNQLIGPTSVGGNGALGKAITDVSNLEALDTNLRAKFALRTPLDGNVLTPTGESTAEMMVDPNSNDWDTLLAAAKYAIERLDLPAGYADDISPVPFITDGRQAPVSLLGLNTADSRYPSLERRSGRRFGLVTLMRLYSETMNVLNTAVLNRYSLRGINGATGSNTAFAATTTVAHHVQFGGSVGGSATASMTMRFQFPSLEARNTFLNSGGAIQLTMNLGSPTTTGDTNMKSLLDQRGVIRLNADKVRIFSSALPLSQSIAPVNSGVKAATAGGVALTTQTVAGASYTVTVATPTDTTLHIAVSFTSTDVMNGALSVKYDVIKDTSTYLAPASTPVFGSPNAYTTGDKTAGSAFFVFQS
jgi:hypothetical protein